MKNASEAPFPYKSKTVCYAEVKADGSVKQVSNTKAELLAAAERVEAGGSTLVAAWPGQWRTDLFKVDDLELLRGAVA